MIEVRDYLLTSFDPFLSLFLPDNRSPHIPSSLLAPRLTHLIGFSLYLTGNLIPYGSCLSYVVPLFLSPLRYLVDGNQPFS